MLLKIRYKGISDVRIMTVEDIHRLGYTVQKDLVWNRRNLWCITTMDLPDGLLEMFREDGAFTLSEVIDEGKEKAVISATLTDDTGPIVVDGLTGQRSEAPRDESGKRADG